MTNKQWRTLQEIVKITEEKFNCLCFAFFDGNFWMIAVDDYDLYRADEFKDWTENCRRKTDLKIVFCYLNPSEEKLVELNEKSQLILNI